MQVGSAQPHRFLEDRLEEFDDGGIFGAWSEPQKFAELDRDFTQLFLQLLGGAEGDLLARLDLDRFAGGGVAAHAGGALAHLKDAEADDADALALLEVLGDLGDEVGQNRFRGLLRQLVFFGQSRGKVLEGDGRWGRCFLSHFWPPHRSQCVELPINQGLFDSEPICLRVLPVNSAFFESTGRK